MAITHGVVSVGTTATLVSAVKAGRDGQTVLVQNPSGAANVFLGGSGVTTTSYGYLLVGGSAFAIEIQDGESLFAVVATTPHNVSVIRQGV